MGNGNVNKGGFGGYATLCGKALALAHCRGDKRSTRFEQAICEVLPLIKNEFIINAQNYAHTIKNDFLYFKKVVENN